MRKSKTCDHTKVEFQPGHPKPVIVVRTCDLPRHHTGKCNDRRGAWAPSEEE